MWLIIILAAVAVAFIVLLVVTSRSITVARQINLDEGMDDTEVVKAYDRISQWPQFRIIRRIIIRELKRHHPHGTLVDIGCGPGYLLVDMVRVFNNLKFIGVDISPQMVEKAIGNITRKGLIERVSFQVGDVQGLPFQSNSLDFVVSTLSLHHWLQPKQGFDEVLRVLKPGGRFLVFDLKRNSSRLAYCVIRFAPLVMTAVLGKNNEPTSSFLASYTPTEIEALMQDIGCTKWRVRAGLFWSFTWGQKQVHD
jgi:ubiquinone/menaquinone biosynthesis C-methylase UbiE